MMKLASLTLLSISVSAVKLKTDVTSDTCKKIENFKLGGKISLNAYLQTLRQCSMNKFKSECYLKSYNLTPYYHLVYLYNCDNEHYENICLDRDLEIRNNQTNRSFYKLSTKELSKVCSRVESIDSHPYMYHEKLFEHIPFCDPFSCGGFSKQSTNSYNCMNTQCFVSTVFFSALDFTVILCIVAMNIYVIKLTISSRNQNLDETITSIDLSKSMVDYFKISLAVTDSMIGCIVLPCLLYMKIRYHQLGSLQSNLPTQILNFTGFFLVFSYSAQFITLMLAGADRIIVLSRPIAYISGSFTKRLTVNALIGWGFSFLIAIFPVFLPKGYQINKRMISLVLSNGKGSIAVYVCGVLLPFLMSLLLAFITYYKLSQKKKVELKAQQLNVKMTGLNGLLPTAKEVQFAKAYVFIVLKNFLSILPLVVTFFAIKDYTPTVTQYDKYRLRTTSGIRYLALMSLVSGSIWNAIIFFFLQPKNHKWVSINRHRDSNRKVSGQSNITEATMVKNSSISSSGSEKSCKIVPKGIAEKGDFWHLNRASVCEPIPSSFDLMDEHPSFISSLTYSSSFVRNNSKIKALKKNIHHARAKSAIGVVHEQPQTDTSGFGSCTDTDNDRKKVKRASSMRDNIMAKTVKRGYQVDMTAYETGTKNKAVRSNSFSVKQQRACKRTDLLSTITKDIRRQKNDGVAFTIPEE